jgi:hypothetical protein
MAKLLLNLRYVPDDEADEVRALLEAHEIEYYETTPSMWGVSAGGIWVRHDRDTAAAARLMADYQERRRARARGEYEEPGAPAARRLPPNCAPIRCARWRSCSGSYSCSR